jgi:hypothetical protein
MVIDLQGTTGRTHDALATLLMQQYGVKLMASTQYWIQVEGDLDDTTVASIMGIDTSVLEQTPEPPTQQQLLAQLNLELELQAEAMSEMMEVLSVL